MFKNNASIRVGSYKKPLKSYPAMETRLRSMISNLDYELLIAKRDLHKEDVIRCLDYTTYFDLVKTPLPTEIDQILHYLAEKRMGIPIEGQNQTECVITLGNLPLIRTIMSQGRSNPLNLWKLKPLHHVSVMQILSMNQETI